MADATSGPAAVPHFPRISAADRADGSVEILAQGESRVFSPQPGRGADDARLRALRHLQDLAAGLGRPVRVTTWTLDRARASLVVTPSGECYDEARPHSSFVIPAGPAGTAGASPAADIPAATRPWGLALPPAPPLASGPGAARRVRRTPLVVAAALALLLLWSGVVAVLLTTGHNDSAAADDNPTPGPSTTAAPTAPDPSTPSTPPIVAVDPPPTSTAPPASRPEPTAVARSPRPGRLEITLSGLDATSRTPVEVRLRIDPASGDVVRRTLRIGTDARTLRVKGLSPGRATWVVAVSGAIPLSGHLRVVAPAPPDPTPATQDPAPEPSQSSVDPTPDPTPDPTQAPPSDGGHGGSHGGGGHGGGGGSGGGGGGGGGNGGHVTTEPHDHGPTPPPHPVDPTLRSPA